MTMIVNQAFIGRPFITEGDSISQVRGTLEKAPSMWAIHTHYVSATHSRSAQIVATCKSSQSTIQVPYACEHSNRGSHYIAAAELIKRECADCWGDFVLLGWAEFTTLGTKQGFVFSFAKSGPIY